MEALDWVEVENEVENEGGAASGAASGAGASTRFVVMRDLAGVLRDSLTSLLHMHTRMCEFEPGIVATPFFVSTFFPYDHAHMTVHEVVRAAAMLRTHCWLYFSPGTSTKTFTQPSAVEFGKIPAAFAERGFPSVPKTVYLSAEDLQTTVSAWPQQCRELSAALEARAAGASRMFIVCGADRASKLLIEHLRVRFWPEATLASMVVEWECVDATDARRYVDVMDHFADKILMLDAWVSAARGGAAVPAYDERMALMARATEAPYAAHRAAAETTETTPEPSAVAQDVAEQLAEDEKLWRALKAQAEAEAEAEAAEAAAAPTSA